MKFSSMRALCLTILLILGLGTSGECRAGQVYLALGDSLTFGLDPSTPASLVPSFADQGFVRPFADFLGSKDGGVRPDLVNLGISGELSTSFLDGASSSGCVDLPPGQPELSRPGDPAECPHDLVDQGHPRRG